MIFVVMLRYLHVLEDAIDTCIEELTRLDNDQDVSDPDNDRSPQ